jgi:hypothetical protein
MHSSRYRSARRAALCALLALALAPGAGAAPARAEVPAPAGDEAMMLAQLPLDAAADRITAMADRPGTGFTNIVLSVPERTVTVYWKGTPPAATARAIAALERPDVHIRLRRAAYSKAELDAAIAATGARRSGYQARGLRIRSLGAEPDGSGLVVRVAAAQPGAGARAAATRLVADRPGMETMATELRAATGVDTRVIPHPGATPTAGTRLEDLNPHYAGARLWSTFNSGCSTGFQLRRRSDGRVFNTTAAHCGGRNEPLHTAWYSYLGPNDANHSFGDTWYFDWDNDTQFIRGGNNVSGRTYDGGVKAGTQFSKPVAGIRAAQYAGNWVCSSGAQTGTLCGAVLQYRWQEWVDGADANVWMWWATKGDHQTANAKGNSGGPVFSLTSDPNRVYAEGTISQGGGNSWSCTNNNGESSTCFDWLGFVSIYDTLNWLGADVQTG